MKGEKLLEAGRFQKGLESLQTAVRLLPNNAQAWNHLGLAYHGLNQPQQALNAYHRALTFDHKLAAARFNVGCLLLEQNNANAALEQLTSYTLLEPGSVEGWLKLASAQMMTEQLDRAEKSYKTALELSSNHPAALNGLGLLQVERHRPLEALQYFKRSLAADSEFHPALLNMAIVTHDQLKNKPHSLQMYKQFLEMNPRPDNWENVATLVQVLEQQLNPAPLPAKAPESTRYAAASKRTSQPSSNSHTQFPPSNITTENPAPEATTRKNYSQKASSAPENQKPTASNPNTILAGPEVLEDSPPTAAPAKTTSMVPTNRPSPPPIQVADPAEVDSKAQEPPKEQAMSTSKLPKVTSESISMPGGNKKEPEPDQPAKPFSRMASAVTVDASRTLDAAVSKVPSDPRNATVTNGFAAKRPSRPLANAYSQNTGSAGYRYIRPTVPLPGNRAAAEPHFKEGLTWHRAGRQAIAVEHYQEATRLDPSFFEAYFNQGVAAAEVASWKHALAAFEMAMAINPDSIKAHYDFCMALKKANYPADALAELKLLVSNHPAHAKSHLALANMYAQQFNQPEKARPHYQKVLELDPFNSEAGKIRYWLSMNR